MSIPNQSALKQQRQRILNTIPLFLSRTYKIVNDSANAHIVQWNDDQYGFHIKDPGTFKSEILPKFFKHKNIQSFSRQLNMYGFRRRTLQDGSLYFSHDFFQKKQMQRLDNYRKLLNQIQRKNSKKSELATNKQKFCMNQDNQEQQILLRKIQILKRKNQLLEHLLQIIIKQNQQAVTQNYQIQQAIRQNAIAENINYQKIRQLGYLDNQRNSRKLLRKLKKNQIVNYYSL